MRPYIHFEISIIILVILREIIEGIPAVGIAREEAFRSEWSNGQTEGQVNRLKTIKRTMYGKAKLDLLRLRVLTRNWTAPPNWRWTFTPKYIDFEYLLVEN